MGQSGLGPDSQGVGQVLVGSVVEVRVCGDEDSWEKGEMGVGEGVEMWSL